MYRYKFPVLLGLSIGLCFILVGRLTAQTFTLLHSFTALNNNTNNDGANPISDLILLGNKLYGTAFYGGSSSNGTVFAVNTNGTGFTNLYSFNGVSDGANPRAGLISSGNSLFGITVYGGSNGFGAVFKVNTDGNGYTNLHCFTGGNDGGYPIGGLTLSNNILYGTTQSGGSSTNGTVYAINTDGTGFTSLYSFTALENGTNADGAKPYAGLVLSSNTLYGTTYSGGSSGDGTVFAVKTDGSGFTNLYSFTALINNTNSDGASPVGGLTVSGSTLYGTAEYGGAGDNGTVFKVNTDGTGFTILYSFTALMNGTNVDGAKPYSRLVLSGNTLYGPTLYGGTGSGTLFAVNTDGSGFTNLYNFTALNNKTNSDGANPSALLLLSDNTLYGTALYGGSSGVGTVFSLSLAPVSPPQLTIIRSGAKVILTWPTDPAGFTLHSTTNLISPAAWDTVSPGPVILNGLNTVTNPITSSKMFYRLTQ